MDFTLYFPYDLMSVDTSWIINKDPEIRALFEHCENIFPDCFQFKNSIMLSDLFDMMKNIRIELKKRNIKWWSSPVSIIGQDSRHGLINIMQDFISIIYMDNEGHPEQKIYRFPLQEKL